MSQVADRLVLEITERTSLDQVKDVRQRVATLREMGFRIAVDDPGAGYAGQDRGAAPAPGQAAPRPALQPPARAGAQSGPAAPLAAGCRMPTVDVQESAVAIDLEALKSERDKLKESLRELEGEQRKVEAELKTLRQREIQTKREIEALNTLVEIHEGRVAPKDDG